MKYHWTTIFQFQILQKVQVHLIQQFYYRNKNFQAFSIPSGKNSQIKVWDSEY